MDVMDIRREYSGYEREAMACGAIPMNYQTWLEFRLRDARNELDLAGYKRTHNPIDAAVVAENDRCEECGGTMLYRGYRKDESYRAFAVCEDCGNAAEF